MKEKEEEEILIELHEKTRNRWEQTFTGTTNYIANGVFTMSGAMKNTSLKCPINMYNILEHLLPGGSAEWGSQ